MGWFVEGHYEHEGWDAAEFTGNRFSSGSANGGATVRHYPPGPGRLPNPTGAPEVVDGRTAIGWRGLCECGWRGPLWQRVDSAEEHDPAAHRIHAPDVDQYGDAPEEVEEAIGAEWLGHLEMGYLAAIREHTKAVAAAQARLTDAVRAAKTAGASWADIGSAAGITKQSAHERWAGKA